MVGTGEVLPVSHQPNFSIHPNTRSSHPISSVNMTRSHKFNDKDHSAVADGTAPASEHLPRFFAKNGFAGEDPKKTKKNGGGKGNWGNAGDEVIDEGFNFANARRRSNSSSFTTDPASLKSKFEVNDPEPVFEESIHGPTEDEELAKTETSSSGGSADEDKASKEH
ncbi:hypothetical protein NKR19_g8195 [Coniochaeta hoffmannii]|uniref:Hyaluronan/mRNA-binding protein domain-containing protein n=1 Tax=Coniochaeta hoffmannii TaxID=91930 RepID=A0AA38R6G6_9PEZI|nr:hypothetical protein NKR19_g8195 [Coniochaeta hoffmannii]